MRLRMKIAATALLALLAVGATSASSTSAANDGSDSTFCTWGGTPADPTGYFTVTPGLSQYIPASEPLKLYVSGELAGGSGCEGRMVFKGVAEPGSTCPAAVFDGKVYGVPGVDHFWGGIVLAGHEFLYDAQGRIVGADQPQVLNNFDHAPDCLTPTGLTYGSFSSTVELFGSPLDPNELQP
jgi:hypothetical protein